MRSIWMIQREHHRKTFARSFGIRSPEYFVSDTRGVLATDSIGLSGARVTFLLRTLAVEQSQRPIVTRSDPNTDVRQRAASSGSPRCAAGLRACYARGLPSRAHGDAW